MLECPDDILTLCRAQDTQKAGYERLNEWLAGVIPHTDARTVMLPNYFTGHLHEYAIGPASRPVHQVYPTGGEGGSFYTVPAGGGDVQVQHCGPTGDKARFTHAWLHRVA